MKAWAIGNFFGLLWAVVAMMAVPATWRWAAALALAVAGAAFVRRGWRARSASRRAIDGMFARRPYLLSVVLELAAIAAASTLLSRFGLQAFLLNVVGVIVGLHFIGLWKATGDRGFIFIAAGMTAVSALSFLIARPASFPGLPMAFLGIGNALVLWIGANRRPASGRPGSR